jgi:hypothetical protein
LKLKQRKVYDYLMQVLEFLTKEAATGIREKSTPYQPYDRRQKQYDRYDRNDKRR